VLYDVLQEKRDMILKIARKHGIQNLRIFGSVARREDGPYSDLDLLVDYEAGRTLFDLIAFKQELEDFLSINHISDKSLHVVTENSIHWSIKEDVLNEAVQL
jgi:uncharacterized protein